MSQSKRKRVGKNWGTCIVCHDLPATGPSLSCAPCKSWDHRIRYYTIAQFEQYAVRAQVRARRTAHRIGYHHERKSRRGAAA